MREVFLVLPLLFKNGFRHKQGEKRGGLGSYFLFAIIMLVYSSLNAYNYIPVLNKIQEMDRLVEYVASVLLIATGAGAIFTISPMLSALYFSKDGEFFLRLPLKPTSVYLAKMLYSYITAVFFAVVTCLPSLICVGINFSLNIAYYLVVLLGLLIVPIFGLLLASIISIPIVFVSSLFKNRGSVSTIVMTVAYALMVGAYMFFILSGSNTPNENTANNLIHSFDLIKQFAFPYTAISSIALLSNYTLFGVCDSLLVSILINFAVIVVFFALAFFITLVMGKIFYNRGVSALLENVKTQKKSSKYKLRSQFTSFLALEWKSVMRNPSVAIPIIGPSIVMPIAIIILSFSLKQDFWGDYLWTIVYAPASTFSLINMSACIAFSKDGARFYAYKSMPVNKSALINAKLLFCWLLSIVPLLISIIAPIIILPVEWWHVVSIIPTSTLTF
jgi:ABC-2 type transport system permease protein